MKSREAAGLALRLHVAGDVVVCENGHDIAVLSRDLFKHDVGFHTALDYVPGQKPARAGDVLPLRCGKCNGAWFVGRSFKTRVEWKTAA